MLGIFIPSSVQLRAGQLKCPKSDTYARAAAFLYEHDPRTRASEVDPSAWEHFFEEPQWPEVDQFFPGVRFLVYPEEFFRRQSSETLHIMAVDGECHVKLVDARTLKNLVGSVKDKVVTEADADKLGRLLLRLRMIKAVYQEGLPEGDYIIERLDEIAFKDEAERSAVANKIEIEPPIIRMLAGGFEWKYMSWDKVGMGGIAVNRLVVDFQKGVELSREYVAHRVGVYQAVY